MAIYPGTGDKNNYYGVIGDKPNFDLSNPELEILKKGLEKQGASNWRYWIGYKYFTKERGELWEISLSQDALSRFFQQWSEEFWEFAESLKEPIGNLNKFLK